MVCSLIEVSFSSLNIIRIKKMITSSKRAKVVYDLYNRYSEAITSILVINCVSGVFASSITACYFTNLLGGKYVGLVSLILTLIILIFTEIIPKIYAREYSEKCALTFSYVFKYWFILLSPIAKLICLFENKLKNNNKVTATKDELVEIVKTIEDEGVIEEKESTFIQTAVTLKKVKVQNIMINKEDVTYLYDTDSSYKVKQCIFKDKHDRIPIITKDNKVAGILYEVDLLDEILDNGKISIKGSMKEAIYVSRNTNLSSCLEILNKARAHMAIVSDRDNNFLGIVTMEDIINEFMKS